MQGYHAGDHHLDITLEHKPHQESIEVLVHSVLLVEAHEIIVQTKLSHDLEEQAAEDHPSSEDVQTTSVLGVVVALKAI